MAADTEHGPLDRLKQEANSLVSAVTDRAMNKVQEAVQGATGRLGEYVSDEGGPGLVAAVTGAKDLAEGKSPARSMAGAGWAGLKEKVGGIFGRKGKGGGRQKLKLTNIVESIDVGVPLRLAYNQWTSWDQFPTFTKKVELTDPDQDDQTYKVKWKAQIFLSHREWEATITDQRPDERILWKSSGQKGHVDGAVTFHELTPNLTKIVLVLEYHPQGMFEQTGNLWRAQGRRARLELKHFQRHVMAHVLPTPDEVEGWRGTIEDGQIVKDHETALEEERREQGEEQPTADDAADEEGRDAQEQDDQDQDDQEQDERDRDDQDRDDQDRDDQDRDDQDRDDQDRDERDRDDQDQDERDRDERDRDERDRDEEEPDPRDGRGPARRRAPARAGGRARDPQRAGRPRRPATEAREG